MTKSYFRQVGMTILLFLLFLDGSAISAEKFSSYRPYPYVFLHGRGSVAHQWGFEPYGKDDISGYGTLNDALHANGNSNGKLFKTFFYQKGYAERLYNEFLIQGECDKSYRVTPEGLDIGSRPKDVPKSRTEILYTDGTPLPPGSCRNYEFYEDFQQLNPEDVGPNPISLPANTLPDLKTWGCKPGEQCPENKHYSVPDRSKWHEMSMNHSYIEAYQGDGAIKVKNPDGSETEVDQEVLSGKWGKTTLVEIARQRIKEVLDEYYGTGNWECDTSKKVILVGYSTGISVAGGVIYHDQKLLKEGKPVLSWCQDNKPTAGNMENARELLSSHIAWVVGHNSVVAGSHYAAKEPLLDGKLQTLTGMPIMAASFTYLFYEDVNTVIGSLFKGLVEGVVAELGISEFSVWWKILSGIGKGLNCLAGGNAVCNGVGGTAGEVIGNIALWQTFKANSGGRLAEDLGWTQDYFTELRSYHKPPLDILSVNDANPRLIEYKTIASKNFLYPKAIDNVITGYFLFNILRHWPIIGPEQRLDRLLVSMAGVAGMMIWRKVAETDLVLEPDEDVTSGKALHKTAKIQHKVLDNIAHAKVSDATNPPCYPYHPDVWNTMRPYMFDPPSFHGSRLSKHKCINHSGDPNIGCHELRPTYPITPATAINKNEFYQDLKAWKNLEGQPLQPPTVVFDPTNKDQVITATDGGGSPLAYETYYESNLMATDKVEGYMNGRFTPLRFRKDYGNEIDPGTHSGLIRVPLTRVRFHNEQGVEQNPFWKDFESVLQDGGNIVGFRGTNPAGTVIEKRVIRYDKKGVIVSVNQNIKAANGSVIASPKSLNLGVFSYKPGNLDPATPEVGTKGFLFAFKTDQVPQFGAGNLDKVKVDVFGTKEDGQLDRTRKVTYTLASNSYPGNSPKYSPYDATADGGKIYLSARTADPAEGVSPHQLFFWIKPDDLMLNDNGKDQVGNPAPSLEGVKHANLLVTKLETGGEPGNQTFYQLEFAIDNSPPFNLKMFSPTLVAAPEPAPGGQAHSYEDRNGDGQLVDDMVSCDQASSGLCDPGVDGLDNNGNGTVDELAELRLIKTYSQGKNERGERINQGIYVRFSLEDNLQAAYPFTENMRWRILNSADDPMVESNEHTYSWGSVFNDFYAFQEGQTWPDGMYSLEVEVPDLAGNVLKTKATYFLIDNTPPQLTLAQAGGALWSGNQSGLAGRQRSLLQSDAYSSTMVKSTEEALVKLKLTPKSGSGTFLINANIPAAFPGTEDDDGIPLIIYDDFQFLELNGMATGDGDKLYQKLPDGKYKVEVYATDKVGNTSPTAIAALSTVGYDFIVDRTPPSISLASVLPFLVPQGEPANLNIQVNQSLDNANTVTDHLQYTLAFDNGPVFRTTEATFMGAFYEAAIPLPVSTLAPLSEGPHRIVLEVAEKDDLGLRNRASLSAVFVNKSWGVVITRPSENGTISSVVPVAGRVADPDIQDQVRFSSFRLSYVSGHFDDPASLPASRQTEGLRAVGSINESGTFETSVPDNLGSWDTRPATLALPDKRGQFTLILESFQADGKRKTALSKLTIDNSTTPPATISLLEFTDYQAPYASFKLTGNPAQVILSVFNGTELINRKSVVAGPLDFKEDYFPAANRAVVGVEAGMLRIRFHPGESANTTSGNRQFAFIVKGYSGTAESVERRFYDADGILLENIGPTEFVTVIDGAIRYSPADAPLPSGDGARFAEVLIPLSLLNGSVNLQFGNRIYDLLNPAKSTDPYLPASAVQLGAARVSAPSNPFNYNLTSAIEWKETNFLGEEIEAGNYSLRLEGFSLDGSEYIPATPAERIHSKSTQPKLRIANATVGADPLVPIVSGDVIKAKAGLSFSVSRSAYVTVNLYKVGDVTPTQQIASKVLVTGGYSRLVDFLSTELKSGQVSLVPNSWYYYRIVAVAKDNSSDVCAVSASEAACYDTEVGAPLKLDFHIGEAPASAKFWDGKEYPPFVLTPRVDSPDPSHLQDATVVTPVSDIAWKVEDVQGRYHPPIRVQYKIKKKGVAPTIYLGYDLKVEDYVESGKSKTEWNYVQEVINGTFWSEGSYKSRHLFLAVRKNWGDGKTVRFYGPSVWAKGGAQTGLTMDAVWNGGTSFGRGPAEEGLWRGDCADVTEGRCYEVEPNPALDFNQDGKFHSYSDIDPDNHNVDYWPSWVWSWQTSWSGDNDEDGFLQLGHWNRAYDGETYSEFGFKGSFTNWAEYATWVNLNMNITRAGSPLTFNYADLGEQGRNQLLPGQSVQLDLAGSSGSLRHMKYKTPEAIGFGFTDPVHGHTYRFERELETESIYWDSKPVENHGWYSLGAEDYGFISDSRDWFKVSGKFIVHGLGGTPIEVTIPPELVNVKLDNRQAHLGNKNVLPSDYVPMFTKTLALTGTPLGACGGSLEYQFLWADETKRYRMNATWIPNPDPGCSVNAAEKVAVSGPQYATLKVSPFKVTPVEGISGGGTDFESYSTYINTADPRFDELPIDATPIVQQLIQNQLGGLIPVDWDADKAFDVEIVAATLPDGSPVPLNRILTGFSAAPDHNLALRIPEAGNLTEDLVGKDWGGFVSRKFGEPALFDSWAAAELTEGYCHAFNGQGGCSNPATSTPETDPNKLFHRSNSIWKFNNDIKLTGFRAVLRNVAGAEHPQVDLFPADQWRKSPDLAGYLLDRANLSLGQVPLRLSLKKGVLTPQRFVSERILNYAEVDRSKTVETHIETDNRLLPIRTVLPSGDFPAHAFEIGQAQGPVMHVAKTFGYPDKRTSSLERMDMRTFIIGRSLNLNSDSPTDRKLTSPFARVTVQYQKPADYQYRYNDFAADVIPVDLQSLAFKFPSSNVPQLDQMIAPAFSIYPDLINFRDFPGNEPTVTYYLRKDEVTDLANPGRDLSIQNLTRIYALNPSSGELTDMTAYITLVSRTETGGLVDFEPKACLEFPGNNPNGVPEEISCTTKANFQTLIASGNWDYVRLIGQPRVFLPATARLASGTASPPPSLMAAPASDDADLGYQQLAYLPMFESGSAELVLDIPQRTETMEPDLLLSGIVGSMSPPDSGLEYLLVEYGYAPKAQVTSFQALKDAGLVKTAAVREDGSFDMNLTGLLPGRTAVLARIVLGSGAGLASISRGEVIYHSGLPQIALAEGRLLSNLERKEVQFRIDSPVSGRLSIDIFDESGAILATLSATAQADARTLVAWNPSVLPGIEAHRILPFNVTLSPSFLAGTTSVGGSIAIDYTLPEVSITVAESQREGVFIQGMCLDGLDQIPLPSCNIALETVEGRTFHEAEVVPDANGEYFLSVPMTDMGEDLPNHSVFRVRISGTQPSGNSNSVSRDATFDSMDEPVIVPFDMSAHSTPLEPRVEFPDSLAGEAFHQGGSLSTGGIAEDGLHLLSAATRNPAGVLATAANNVLLDMTAPHIDLSGLPPDGAVVGTPVQLQVLIEDDYLVSGTLSVTTETGPVTLQMRQQGEVLRYSAFNFGSYAVRVGGLDLAGNRTEKVSRFTYDQGAALVSAEFAENAYVPVIDGQVELRWNVLEDHPEWISRVEVSLGGQAQSVVYTEASGRAGSLTRYLTRVPVDPSFEGPGTVSFTVDVPGEVPVSLIRTFRVNQSGPVLASLDPQDNAKVQRRFDLRAVFRAPVGLDHVEATFADGTILTSVSLTGETEYALSAQVDYQGSPLQLAINLTARDKLGRILRREVRYTVFDIQVLMRDNAFQDNRIAKPQIKLVNLSQQPLTGFTARLWLSRLESPGMELAVDRYGFDPCGVLVKVRSHPANANLLMVDFVYPEGYQVPAGGQSPEAGWQVGLHYKSRTAGPIDKSNDWSWSGITGTFKETKSVTLYDASGVLLYGQEPDPASVPQPPAGSPPAENARVTSSLMAQYAFHEGEGTTTSDIAASGIPMDLTLLGANAKWMPTGGLDLTYANHNAVLENRTPNRKLFTGSTLSGQVSVEAWIEPANITQNTARIIEYGDAGGAFNWNWSLVQNQKNLEFRLRTSSANPVYLISTGNPIAVAGAQYHVLISYEPYDASTGKGGMRMYVNGVLAASNQESGGLRSTGTNAWDPLYILTIGNRTTALDRDWHGKIHLASVYGKSLTSIEATRNFNAGVVEPAIPDEVRLGVVCGERALPFDILDGSGEWKQDKASSGATIAMGGTIYTFGLGGKPQLNGSPAWMVYDLQAEKVRLELAGTPLRLTGFGGKQDGSAVASIFVKTSPNAVKPGDNDWINGTGGVIQRFNSSNGTNLPMSVDLKYSRWLLLGVNSTQSGSNLHGVFGDMKLLYGPVPQPAFAPKLVYRYYQVDQMCVLPSFDGLVPMKSGLSDRFELSPKLRSDDFAFEFVGFLNVAAAGLYTFFTSSDDGSRLFLDGKMVVENDGVHGSQERSGQVALVPGYHAIKVQFFERGGGEVLDVKYQGPGIAKSLIPAEALFHSETFGYNLEAKYYEGTWNNLPSFEAMSPLSTDFRNGFKISPRNLQDYFGFAFDGNVFIPAAGDYTFFLNSDDGSQLFVDEQRIVDNDGWHAMQERSGTVSLQPGFHSIRVTYFERSGSEGIEVKYQGPGIFKSPIPVELLFSPYPQLADPNQGGKSGAFIMGGENVDRNYTISGTQWFKVPLSNYANTWANTVVVALDDMDGRLMVGSLRIENLANQSIDGWFKSYPSPYNGQNELYFTIEVPEKRTYKVRWWFQ